MLNINSTITKSCREEIKDCILDEGINQATWCIKEYGAER